MGMKNQRIEDQTELPNLVIAWGEKKEVNGMIVSLDQEKAYDRIQYEFIWATLEAFGFPVHFIDTVKMLYCDAKTVAIVNGKKNTPYKMTRGVRQGDPMSCLIFNLAIESLAQMLRDSQLRGIKIGEEAEHLIVKLFADDTTVYLSEGDNLDDLKNILDNWCKASGGKFNVLKTAIIPVESKSFRNSLTTTRTVTGTLMQILEEIKIAKEGEPTRLLGSYIGNHIDNPSVWAPTLEKITQDLTRWNRGHPTIDG